MSESSHKVHSMVTNDDYLMFHLDCQRSCFFFPQYCHTFLMKIEREKYSLASFTLRGEDEKLTL